MKKYNNMGINMGGLSITDPKRYQKIYAVLNDKDVKKDLLDIVETIPLEYAYNLADTGATAEDDVVVFELNKNVTDALGKLKPREEETLRLRFGIGHKTDHTLGAVGKKLYVTPERVRQIEAKALRKLRLPSKTEVLRDFLR